MIEVTIPGYKTLRLAHLVMDYNGTMAGDGHLIDGVREKLETLCHQLEIHVITADTFGKARSELAGGPAALSILPEADQERGKLDYICKLGQDSVVAIGNGRNDRLMLKEAQLGIALIQKEGACVEIVMTALRHILERLRLTLNEAKTKVVDTHAGKFDFLGFTAWMGKSRKTGNHYPHVQPSRKAVCGKTASTV